MECLRCHEQKLSSEFSSLTSIGKLDTTELASLCLRCLQKVLHTCNVPDDAQKVLDSEISCLEGKVPWKDSVQAALRERNAAHSTISIVMVTGGHVTMPVTLDTTVKDVKIFLGQHQDRKPYYYRLLLGKKDMKVRAPDGTANKLVRYTGPQCAGVTVTAIAPYSAYAGMNTIPGAAVDDHGNAHGAAYDLGEDGAFQGLTAAVLQLSGFDFVAPRTALEEKGFTLVHWVCIPSEAEFTQALSGAFQCWVISGHSGDAPLGAGHLDSLKHFYERGGGVYLWGDNDPYFFHANVVAHTLLGPGISLEGNDWGDRHLSPRPSTKAGSGFDSNSLLFTGIAKLYEGITIARVCAAGRTGVKTIMVSSHRQPLPGVINDGRHRLIVDGGFTRLFCHWDAAGSARFVKNASAWLCGVDADWV